MRAKRPPHLAPAIDGVAESLPFPDQSFDAGMSTFSVHQWADVDRGLREMRRVARGPVVILSCDPAAVRRFWLADYVPEVLAAEARRYPAFERMARALGGRVDVHEVDVPFDCSDGFNEAYYGRPEMFLDDQARLACSAWSFVAESAVASGIARLARATSPRCRPIATCWPSPLRASRTTCRA
jgi:SAM-dependent methyltransferase